MTESPNPAPGKSHQQAFEIYVSLGPARTYRQVAARTGVTLATVKRWARAEGWKSRVGEQEAQAARDLHDRYSSGLLAQNERNLKIVRAAILRLAKDISEGKVKSQLSDLPRLLQLEQDMLKEPGADDPRPESHRSAVVLYLPDNGSSPPGTKIWTKEELRRDGHDVDNMFF